MSLFMSLIGMAVLLGIAVLLSSNRKAINLRTVGGAFAINFHWVHLFCMCLGAKSYFVAFRMPYRMLLTTVTMVLHSSSVDWYQAKCLKCLAAAVSFSHSAYYQH